MGVFYCSLPNSSLSNAGSVNKLMATSWLGDQREAGPTLKLRSRPALKTVNYFQVCIQSVYQIKQKVYFPGLPSLIRQVYVSQQAVWSHIDSGGVPKSVAHFSARWCTIAHRCSSSIDTQTGRVTQRSL